MIESEYLKDNQEIKKKLRQLSSLKQFDEKDFQGLMQLSKIRKYAPGEKILTEGEYDCWIYFLISGKVKVIKGKEELAVISRHGDVFGEMAIVDNGPRSASVVAIDEAICLASDVSYMSRLTGNDRFRFGYFLYQTFAKVLVDRLRLGSENLAVSRNSGTANAKLFLDQIAELPPIRPNPVPKPPPNAGKSQQTSPSASQNDHYLILEGSKGNITVRSGDIIGRIGTGKELLEHCQNVSRLHAIVSYSANQWRLEDMKSRNGTYINGNKIEINTPHPLKNRDDVWFSDFPDQETRFKVSLPPASPKSS